MARALRAGAVNLNASREAWKVRGSRVYFMADNTRAAHPKVRAVSCGTKHFAAVRRARDSCLNQLGVNRREPL